MFLHYIMRYVKYILLFICLGIGQITAVSQTKETEIQALEEAGFLFVAEGDGLKTSLKFLEETWVDGYIPVLLDVLHFQNYKRNGQPIIGLLSKMTGQDFGTNLDEWNQWMWNRNIPLLSNYADWLAGLYENIDPKFSNYFQDRTKSTTIRLDEIKWGGVVQDGIPPLRNPKMIKASEAKYLGKFDVVFGISINGDHRAYPKRILAWHEMFVDDIGGLPIAGVYCTLCGTVIAYEHQFEGRIFHLGTSGFLYRSNKLMYDKATQSLWNTIEGKPVLGPLIDQGIELPTHSVVTTTWGEWKKLHPNTQVLSLETGHDRDYSEGKAYENYFGTDNLMFQVPSSDDRLANKAEVFVIRSDGYQNDPLAISAKFLKKHRVYQEMVNDQRFVVITDKSGANRAYATDDQVFEKLDSDSILEKDGKAWKILEEYLEDQEGNRLKRLSAHRVFWFAWFSMYNHTRLVK